MAFALLDSLLKVLEYLLFLAHFLSVRRHLLIDVGTDLGFSEGLSEGIRSAGDIIRISTRLELSLVRIGAWISISSA